MSVHHALKARKIELFKNRERNHTEAIELSLLNVILSEAERSAKTASKELDDSSMLRVLKKMWGSTKETLEKAHSNETELELCVIESLLNAHQPKQMTKQELVELSYQFSSIGEYMKHLKANHDGQYDGKVANAAFASKVAESN